MEDEKTFNKWVHKIEDALRANFITLSCDTEWALMWIAVCSICLNNKGNEKVNNYKKMTLSPMIDHTMRVLKEYSEDEFKLHEDMFKELKEINEMRRKVAHCYIRGDINRIDKSFITIVDITADGQLILENHTFIELNKMLNNFKDILLKLALLADKLNTLIYAKLGYYIPIEKS